MMRLKILSIMLVLILLMSCSQPVIKEQNSNNGQVNKKVTIHFMHLWSEELFTAKYNVINDIVNQYMTLHPEVTIKVEILDNEQYKDKLKIVSTSNSLPDVGVTWPSGYLQPYVDGKLFAQLDNVISEELNVSFNKGTTDAFKVNGHTYGLPLEFNITPIYYNKEIFETYNLNIPQTYSEFIKIVEVLSANEVIPIALGNKEQWTGSLWYLYLAERFAGPHLLKSALDGQVSFNNPELLRAAEEIQHLVKLGAFNKGFNGVLNDEAKHHFYEEGAAMYLMGTWELGNFTSNPDIPQSFKDKIGFFKFPFEPFAKGNMNSWVGGPGVGLFVAENSKVKDEAKDFAAFFVKEWGEKSVVEAGVIPATKVDTRELGLPQLYHDILDELKRANSLVLYADVMLEQEDAEQHLNLVQALYGLAITPEQFNSSHDAFLLKEEHVPILSE